MAKRQLKKTSGKLGALEKALREGRHADAWTEARKLLAGQKPNPQTLNLAGIAAYHVGDAETALALLQDAAAATRSGAPLYAEIQMNLGNILAGRDDVEGALAAYDAAHDASPRYAEPAYNAGVLLMRIGDHSQAAIRFEAALSRDPEHVQAAIGYSEAARCAGNLEAAAAALQTLLARDSSNAIALTNLAAVLSAQGQDAEARTLAERAAEIDPGLAAAHYNAGVALQALHQHEDAAQRFRHTLALEPGHAAAALNMGEAYLALDETPGAESAFKRALEIDPTFAKAAINLADMALHAGDANAAVAIIDRFLARTPGHPSALAFKAIALREAGKIKDARILDDTDRFIMTRDIVAPDGYTDVAAFNRALGEHLLAHPTLTPAPKAHATRAGRHSGELLDSDRGPVGGFADLILEAFNAYRRRFVGEASHPFLDQIPENPRLSVWGVVMEEGGHQVPHIHPSAWLSGVYYVEVPDNVREDDATHAGWIEFGRPPADFHFSHTPEARLLHPKAGQMILFPSHFYHRTVPLSGKNRRISIAFDVVPVTSTHVETP